MDKHTVNGDIHEVVYGDGTRLVVNYGNEDFFGDGFTVKANDYFYLKQ